MGVPVPLDSPSLATGPLLRLTPATRGASHRLAAVFHAPGHLAAPAGPGGGGAEGGKRSRGAGARAPRCPARDLSPSAAAAAAAAGRGVEGSEKGWSPGQEGGRRAARQCQESPRGAWRSPALLPGARMQTLKLALLG